MLIPGPSAKRLRGEDLADSRPAGAGKQKKMDGFG